MLANQFASITTRKFSEISKALNLNISLFSFYQFNRDVFKLSTINMHLIILSDFILKFFQKKTKVDHLLNILIFIFFSYLLFKDFSISINIWRKKFHKLCNEFNTVMKKFNLSFFLMISYSLHCFSKRSRNFMMLYLSKYKVFEIFETGINIIYRTVENMMSESDSFEIEIKDEFLNDKLTWWKLNIDFTTIVWQ